MKGRFVFTHVLTLSATEPNPVVNRTYTTSLGRNYEVIHYSPRALCMVTHTARQPDKVANPARDQLTEKNNVSLPPFAPENLVSQDGFGSPVPRQPA